MAKPIKVIIKKSNKEGKKLMAIFTMDNGRTRTTHFGASGMSDYTKNRDKERKQRYLKRHRRNENWNNPLSAGALSRWILWNKETRGASINDFKRRFNLK